MLRNLMTCAWLVSQTLLAVLLFSAICFVTRWYFYFFIFCHSVTRIGGSKWFHIKRINDQN